MNISDGHAESLLSRGFTRRHIGRMASVFAAGAAVPFFSEYALAQKAERRMMGRRAYDETYIRISSNENPMGPCKEGVEALCKAAPEGWRYSPHHVFRDFVQTVAETLGVKESYVSPHSGSSDPLFRAACAFTSPTRSWVMADPGYGSGAPEFIGSKTVKVPLRANYTHDVEAMIKADPNAGVYYVCNPNNPTGTVTPRKDINYLLANKPKDAVVVLDEAYVHFSDTVEGATDLVSGDKDVVVLRTFSKVYGMAGLRAGLALARPDLLAKFRPYGTEYISVSAAACATASMSVKNLVPERRQLCKRIREDMFGFFEKKNVKYVPSETNFFMMDVNRPGEEFAKALADQKIIIGRVWAAWPTKVRVTIGTQEEMNKFKAACDKVWAA